MEHPRDLWSIDGTYRSQDAFALPAQAPHQAQLGNACRVNLVPIALRPDVDLLELTLETLSPEVVVALLAVTIEM
jgi:hypothetical protein